MDETVTLKVTLMDNMSVRQGKWNISWSNWTHGRIQMSLDVHWRKEENGEGLIEKVHHHQGAEKWMKQWHEKLASWTTWMRRGKRNISWSNWTHGRIQMSLDVRWREEENGKGFLVKVHQGVKKWMKQWHEKLPSWTTWVRQGKWNISWSNWTHGRKYMSLNAAKARKRTM
jgi:hypothetical protein